jgi:hypothetical protein
VHIRLECEKINIKQVGHHVSVNAVERCCLVFPRAYKETLDLSSGSLSRVCLRSMFIPKCHIGQ